MIYSSILTILIALFISGEIYFLGKFISKSSGAYKFNESGSILLGAIVYFVITFFTFFAFIWIKPTILYFVVIFLIKETIQVIFLILRRDSFKGMKINWVALGCTGITMIIFPLMFNFALNDALDLHRSEQVNAFQTWYLFHEVIAELSSVDVEFITKWLMSAVSSLMIYSSVTLFIISFSKKKSWVDYLISIFITFFLMLLFNFGFTLNSMVGIFILLFSIQLSVEIIMKSRRRFAVFLGLTDIVLWFFDPNLFLAIISLSIVVILLYTLLEKNKISLFWVQIISPITLLTSLWLYTTSPLGALVLVAVSIISYTFMVGIGRLDLLDKIDKRLKKISIFIPILFTLVILILALTLGFTNNMSKEEVWLFENSIWESYGNNTWNIIQNYLYYIIMTVSVIVLIFAMFKKVKIVGYRIAGIISILILIGAYSAILNIITHETILENQFKFIRVVAFMPLTIIPFIFARRYIKI